MPQRPGHDTYLDDPEDGQWPQLRESFFFGGGGVESGTPPLSGAPGFTKGKQGLTCVQGLHVVQERPHHTTRSSFSGFSLSACTDSAMFAGPTIESVRQREFCAGSAEDFEERASLHGTLLKACAPHSRRLHTESGRQR